MCFFLKSTVVIFVIQSNFVRHFVHILNVACIEAWSACLRGECDQSSNALMTCRLVRDPKVMVAWVWPHGWVSLRVVPDENLSPLLKICVPCCLVVSLPVDVTVVYVIKNNVSGAAISNFILKRNQFVVLFSLQDDGLNRSMRLPRYPRLGVVRIAASRQSR